MLTRVKASEIRPGAARRRPSTFSFLGGLAPLCATLLAGVPLGSSEGPEIPVSGIVRDAEGEPVAGATVSLHPAIHDPEAGEAGASAGPRPAAVTVTRSAPDGSFSLSAPGEGFWTLVVRTGGREIAEARLWPLLESSQVELVQGAPGALGAAPAGVPGEAAAPEAAAGRRLVGRVAARPYLEPVAGAWVWPAGEPDRVVLSGPDGSFELVARSVSPEGFRVGARGYLPATRDWPRDGGAEDGAFVAGAVAALAPELLHEGLSPWPEPGVPGVLTATSDAEGVFRFAGVPAGSAALSITAAGKAAVLLADLEVPPGVLDLGDVEVPDQALVEGTVTDSRGDPVAGARVEGGYWAGPAPGVIFRRFTSATDGAGWFRVEGLPGGAEITLHVTADGFLARREQATAPTGDPLAIELTRAVRIEGKVIDERGRAVSGASVTSVVRGEGGESFQDYAITDDGGRFGLTELESGQAELEVRAAGYYLPEPLVVAVSPGEPRREVEIVVDSGHAVAGRVLAASGEPITGATVGARAGGRGSLVQASAQSDSNGAYRIAGLPEGPVAVTAIAPGTVGVQETVEVGPGDAVLDLVLDGGTTVSGRAVRASGEALAGHPVRLEPEPSTGAGEPVDGPSHLRTGGGATTGADGSFTISGVGDGELRLVLFAREEGLAGTSPWRYVHPEPVIVAGSPVSGLLVRLPPLAAIRGHVLGLDGDELAELSLGVVASDDDLASGFYLFGRSGTVHADGSFEIDGLFPGSYEVVAQLPDGRRASGRIAITGDGSDVRVELVFDPAPPGDR